MRFNKTFSAISLAVLSASSLAGTSFAADNESRNEGRKLSMSVPGLGTAHITVTPARSKPIISGGKALAPGRHVMLGKPSIDPKTYKKDVSIEANGNNITVRVPASVDDAIADVQVVTRQVSKVASRGVADVSRYVDLLVLYFKQWTGNSAITPAGYPYVDKSSAIPAPPTTIASGHKLYYTGEGRLKSVVAR